MSEELGKLLSGLNNSMNKVLDHLESELLKIRAGKADPGMLDGVSVEYYGSKVPISQVANVIVTDARSISIQPWEKKSIPAIERAILQANIGVTPQADGEQVRIFMPPLTEDRRKEMVKKAAAEGEHAKIAIRNVRRDLMEDLKKLQKGGLSEDEAKDAEKKVQNTTNDFTAKIDKVLEAKEKSMMSI